MPKRPTDDRRALTNLGGEVTPFGDPALARPLIKAFTTSDEPVRLTHGFHPWPARMHPETARALIATAPKGPIADPFMGGGTVPLETMLAGRAGWGTDVNPVALEVAWARTRAWRGGRLADFNKRVAEVVKHARHLRKRGKVPPAVFEAERDWFDMPALLELWSLEKALSMAARDASTRMARVCLSSIVVRASRQVSDSVTKRDRDHKFIPKGRVEQWFTAKVAEHSRNLDVLAGQLAGKRLNLQIMLRDARTPPPEAKGIGAIITSPPYPGVYDYASHQRRRYALFGQNPNLAFRAEVGARREVNKQGPRKALDNYVADLAAVLLAWRPRLAPKAAIFLVIGDGQTRDGAVPVLPLVEHAAEGSGFQVVAGVTQARPTFGPEGRRDDDKHEHIIQLAAR